MQGPVYNTKEGLCKINNNKPENDTDKKCDNQKDAG